jgi:YgiT-type zinc finger domain-containing protein
MKCFQCHGNMKHKTTPFHIDKHGYHLVMDAVPAWVCAQCGEVYFETSEVDAIQNLIRAVDVNVVKLAKSA